MQLLDHEKHIIGSIVENRTVVVACSGLNLLKIIRSYVAGLKCEMKNIYFINFDEMDKAYMDINISFFLTAHQLLFSLLRKKIHNLEYLIINNIDKIGFMKDFIFCILRKTPCKIIGFSTNPFITCELNLNIFPRFHDVLKKDLDRKLTLKQIRFTLLPDEAAVQVLLVDLFKKVYNEAVALTKCPREDINIHEVISMGTYKKFAVNENMVIRKYCRILKHVDFILYSLYNLSIGFLYELVKQLYSEHISQGFDQWIDFEASTLLYTKINSLCGGCIELPTFSKYNTCRDRKYTDAVEYESAGSTSVSSSDVEQPVLYKPTTLLNSKKLSKIISITADRVGGIKYTILCKHGFIREELLKALKIPELSKKRTGIRKFTRIESQNIEIYTFNEFSYIDKIEGDIILYEPDIRTMRKIECLNAGIETDSINISLFTTRGSLEEFRSIANIRREKEAFEKLIISNASKPKYIFNEMENDSEDLEGFTSNVFVDSRELRASLPFAIYQVHTNIIVRTLEIGDYIVGRDTVVERKSIPDLVQSLQTGRLYAQYNQSSIRYKYVFLLVEFNVRSMRLMSILSKNAIRNFIQFIVYAKNCKILWSDTDETSIFFMQELQRKDDPCITPFLTSLDPIIYEMLLSIPGITFANMNSVQENFENFVELSRASQDSLITIFGQSAGRSIFSFFNDEVARNVAPL